MPRPSLAAIVCLACASTPPPPATAPPPRPAAPVADPTPPAFRLPKGVHARAAAVDLTLRPDADRFQGSIDLEVELAENTRVVWLHAENLTPREATVTFGGRHLAARTIVARPSWLGVVAPSEIGPGPAQLHIAYEGTINGASGAGIFRGVEKGEAYLQTQFEQIFARQAFPCFDEPGFKIPWRLTLRVPRGLVVAANSPIAAEEPAADGLTAVRFEPTAPLPAYLVAFAVGPYDVVDGGVAGKNHTPLRYLVPKGRAAEAEILKQQTPRILEWLEDYMGVPYPYAKLDTVAVAGSLYHGGAMENAGLITGNAEWYLGKGDDRTKVSTILRLQAHEVAHMWFGDLVTPVWWDDLWLNEAFASWMARKVATGLEPALFAPTDRVALRGEAIGDDLAPTALPLHRPVTDDFGIENAVSGLYRKGEAVLNALEAWIGPEAWRAGVHAHLTAHAHGTATAADFAAALSRAAAADVTGVMTSFTDNAGVPLVTGRVSCAGGAGKLEVTQRRLAPGTPTERWRIPICVRHGGAGGAAQRECFVLDGERGEHTLASCPAWVAWNAGANGYYVVATDGETLARSLAPNSYLDDDELLATLHDVQNLLSDGLLPAGDALRATTPLLARATPAVLEALVGLEGRALNLVAPADLEAMRARVRERFGPAAHRLPLIGPPDEPAAQRDARMTLIYLVSEAGDPSFAKEAQRLARAWLADRSKLGFWNRYIVLRVAARFGDRELYDALEAAARVAGRDEQRSMLGAMAAFGDGELVERTMRLALTDAIHPRNLATAFYTRIEHRDRVFRFVAENLDRILERLPADLQVSSVYLGSRLRTAEQRALYVGAFEPRLAAIKNGAGAYQETLANFDRWLEVATIQRPSLHAWLSERGRARRR